MSKKPVSQIGFARQTEDLLDDHIARPIPAPDSGYSDRKPKPRSSLTARQRAFVMEYLTDLSATQAAIRAGYSRAGAKVTAHKLLTNANVAAEIARQSEDRFRRLRINADDLIERAAAILMADPRALTGYHIGPCRYCWGIDHDYQWKTRREYRDACAEAALDGRPEPSDAGGFGFRLDGHANPDCPECCGFGTPRAVFADTRNLSPEAAILFEGIEETRDGIRIRMASKEKAFDVLARVHRLFVERHEHTGKDGAPIAHDHKVKARVILIPPKVEAPVESRPLRIADRA
ncbi:terminase small subunit [Gemmobacter sp.]|uniref:terminase small subunit n=1 Tax=Gemmobacter sp. TaxID=1898957 RepID=UPI002AFEB40E|nr:terminase small subunit [Gemmobacter sp.]